MKTLVVIPKQKYQITAEVDEQYLKFIHINSEDENKDNVEHLIREEFNWLSESGIFLDKITKVTEQTYTSHQVEELLYHFANHVVTNGLDIDKPHTLNKEWLEREETQEFIKTI